jgi:peptidyl-prolyl cis-trans isomerase A (cyclophilin A)
MRYGRRQFMQFCTAAVLASLTTMALAADPAPKVSIKTSMGEIILEVYPDKAPKTVENFLTYVKSGFYNGTIFHRVINGFMVQGGGYDQSMKEKPTRAPIQNEAKNGLKNRAYTIAMARTSDPDSATAQFFINVKDNQGLDFPNAMGNGYTVFGKVISGTQTIDAIRKVPTMVASAPRMGRMADVPAKTVTIESATLLK